MKRIISKVVNALVAEAEEAGCELTLKTLGGDGYLISNKPTGKVAAIGVVNISNEGEKERIIGAFTININKYQWAEAEGFSQQQMIEKLQNEIFQLIGIDEVADYLCE